MTPKGKKLISKTLFASRGKLSYPHPFSSAEYCYSIPVKISIADQEIFVKYYQILVNYEKMFPKNVDNFFFSIKIFTERPNNNALFHDLFQRTECSLLLIKGGPHERSPA